MSFASVSVVGAGPVACGIAIAIARTGTPVTLVRASHGGDMRLALERVDRRLGWAVDAGELSAEERGVVRARIDVASDLPAVRDSDLVIESAAGELRSRRATLATLETHLSGGAVLAVNAQAHHLPELAEVLRRKDQFVGMRFFHPATHTHLVELGLLADTAPGVAAACRAFCGWLAKTPVEQTESTPRIGYREYLMGTA
jgi:3-hydroxyacyl-CoA dehydrogenase